HKRGLKVTGHLCSVTYVEAAEIGIDNLEHGFRANTEFDSGKKPDVCSDSGGDDTLDHMGPDSPEAKRLFATLVSHHTAITSTPAGPAPSVPSDATNDARPLLRPAALEAMSPQARETYLYNRNRARSAQSNAAQRFRRDMDLQRAFVAAGGLLIAGPDPTGIGGSIPGFRNTRHIRL